MKSLLVLAVASVLLSGCSPDSARLDAIERRLQTAELTGQTNYDAIEALSRFAFTNQVIGDRLGRRVTQLEYAQSPSPVGIDTDGKGYQSYPTDQGTLLVSTKLVDPYLDGYKVTLEIINTASVDFNGFRLMASWGPPLTTSNSFTWYQEQHSITNDVVETLLGSYGNDVQVTLAPCSAAELRQATFEFQLGKIAYRTRKPKP